MRARNSSDEGKRISILCIDGGGVRGIIPAQVLECLENLLQKFDGKDARIADYFDLIAGTSTGGLIASMLACPDENGRPLFTAKQITEFYMKYSEVIFPRQRSRLLRSVQTQFSLFKGPKYSATSLEQILEDHLKEKRIKDTITDVLIPAFDISLMHPVFFSTAEAKENSAMDVRLRDVCRSTSAAPMYFPPHSFWSDPKDPNAKGRQCNNIDGGIAVNNPTHLAIVHVMREKEKRNKKFCLEASSEGDTICKRLVMLSLGTGKKATESVYTAEKVSKWGALRWVLGDKTVPIVEIAMEGSDDMVDHNTSILFDTANASQNYLRIQAFDLKGDATLIDNSEKMNLEELARIGSQVLSNQVSTTDRDTGRSMVRPHMGTNHEFLERLAKELIHERKARAKRNI